MGVKPYRPTGIFVNFNSNKVESSTGEDYYSGTLVRRVSLVCTTLSNITFPNSVWTTAYVEWVGLESGGGDEGPQQQSIGFEIWRDFNTADQQLVCSTTDTNVLLRNGEAARATTTLTCVDKMVPFGSHTYCIVAVIPTTGVLAVSYGMRAFNREITATEIKV